MKNNKVSLTPSINTQIFRENMNFWNMNQGRQPFSPKKTLSIVGMAALFSLAMPAQLFATQYSEQTRLTISANNQTVKEILYMIEGQSDFRFIYESGKVDLDKRVTVNFKNQSVEAILDNLFGNAGIQYEITENNFILINPTSKNAKATTTKAVAQQQKRVTGKVVDKNGEPVIGANVVVKGTTNGTITDIVGNFSLEVADGALLEVSYIGYLNQEIKVGNQKQLAISLSEDTQNLDEVVVVGYGTVKKSDLTGSVSSVKAEELAAFPVASPAQALQGRTSGVHVKQSSGEPGGSPTVRIRGTNSILGGNDPLYVIDGFPTNSGLALLSSDDIESIEVLKDASSIAIYGSRGSNGVILVTTKKGKAGKTKVDFSTTLGLQKLAKKMDMMNAQEYAQFYNERLVNDGKEAYFSESEINALGEGFDWQDFVYSTQPIRTHALDISGGTDRTQFTVGANIFDQQGIVGVGSYKRYTLRTDVNHKITDRLKVNVNTTLTRSINDNKSSQGGRQGGTIVSASLLAPPTATPYNEDGTYTVLENCLPFVTTGGGLINPLNIMNEVTNVTKRNSVLANAAFTYEPIDGLVLKVSGGVENRDGRNDYYKGLEYWNSQGSASVSTSQEISLLNENTISYTKTFAKKHFFSALAGFTYQDYEYKYLAGSGNGYLSDVTETGNLGSASSPGIPSSSYTKWVLLSSIARVNYTFDNRYLLTFSFRADGSSRYSEGNKWGYFPSGAIAWRMSEEPFMKELEAISDLKWRASYGVSGSQAISPYSTLNNLYAGKTVFGNDRYTYFAPGSTKPADLKWETTSQFDLGLDFGVLDNKLHFTADYYIKETKDLLNSIQLPTSTGYSSTLGNIGQIRNSGFELTIDAHPFTGDFKWDLTANISTNRSKVKKLYEGQDILGGWIGFMVVEDNSVILREGEPMGVFYGYLQDGYDEKGAEKYKDVNGDGILNQDDKTIIGDPNPDFIYGLNSSMRYKDFEFSFFLQGSQGNDLFNASSIDNTLYYAYGLNQQREVLYNHWTPENPNAKYPKPVNGLSMRLSDRFVENGSYLRLKNVEFAYNLPVKKWNWKYIQRARLSLSMQNLFTITSYSGWDPDVNMQGGGIAQGIDQNAYPVARTYTFGINMTF